MKKAMFPFLAMLVLIACGSKKDQAVSEAKKIMSQMTETINKASKAIESAKDGKEAAVALESFATELKSLKEKADALDKKYPELKSSDNKALPELEAEMQAFNEAIGKLMTVLQADVKKLESPEFITAIQKLEGL